jgi:hypothetical protein
MLAAWAEETVNISDSYYKNYESYSREAELKLSLGQ